MFVGNDGGIAKTSNPFGTVSTNPCNGAPGVTWTQLNEGYSTIQVFYLKRYLLESSIMDL